MVRSFATSSKNICDIECKFSVLFDQHFRTTTTKFSCFFLCQIPATVHCPHFKCIYFFIIQEQQGLCSDVHPVHRPLWGVHIPVAKRRGHQGPGETSPSLIKCYFLEEKTCPSQPTCLVKYLIVFERSSFPQKVPSLFPLRILNLQHCYFQVVYFLEGLKKRSKFVVVLQEFKAPGKHCYFPHF